MVTEPEVVKPSGELGAPTATVAEFKAVAKFSSSALWVSGTAMLPAFHIDEDG